MVELQTHKDEKVHFLGLFSLYSHVALCKVVKVWLLIIQKQKVSGTELWEHMYVKYSILSHFRGGFDEIPTPTCEPPEIASWKGLIETQTLHEDPYLGLFKAP